MWYVLVERGTGKIVGVAADPATFYAGNGIDVVNADQEPEPDPKKWDSAKRVFTK